jgi:signal peptidase I
MLLDGDRPVAPVLKAVAKEHRSVKLFLGLFLGIPCLAMIMLYLIYPSIFSSHFPGVRALRIVAESMAPTLKVGDSVLVNYIAYDRNEPQRGDIACYEMSNGGTPSVNVKRIVAVGGDVLFISGQHITLNGKPVSEPYIAQDATSGENAESESNDVRRGPIKVQANHFFILGDNRDDSFDSRSFGAIDRSQIIGRATFVIRADDPSKQWHSLR